jgi:hypothetical protein
MGLAGTHDLLPATSITGEDARVCAVFVPEL